MSKIISIPNILGGTTHYDSNGSAIGTSEETILGDTVTHFDDGRTYYTTEGIVGDQSVLNSDGTTAGYIVPSVMPGYSAIVDVSDQAIGYIHEAVDDVFISEGPI